MCPLAERRAIWSLEGARPWCPGVCLGADVSLLGADLTKWRFHLFQMGMDRCSVLQVSSCLLPHCGVL